MLRVICYIIALRHSFSAILLVHICNTTQRSESRPKYRFVYMYVPVCFVLVFFSSLKSNAIVIWFVILQEEKP